MFPEYHKYGECIHFHGLMSGDLSLQDSGKKTEKGQTIYNTDSWTYGFSTVVRLEGNLGAVTSYITKYITKDSKKIFGNFYYAGGNLVREVPTSYHNVCYAEFDGNEYVLPGGSLSMKFETYQTEQNDLLRAP